MTKIPFDDINQSILPFVDKYELISNVRVLRLKGPIDSETLPKIVKFKEEARKRMDIDADNVLLDLKKVTRGDSASLSALIIRLSELKKRNKKLGLINVPEKLKYMLSICKCDELFSIFDTEEAALENMNKYS